MPALEEHPMPVEEDPCRGRVVTDSERERHRFAEVDAAQIDPTHADTERTVGP